jgi:hypothetical protein
VTISQEEQSMDNHEGPAASASVAELIKSLSEQTSRLAHQEVELAVAELQLKGKRAGLGAGMFGGAGLLGLYALGAWIAAAIILLGRALTPWLSAAIVGVALGAAAGAVALLGKRQVSQAAPPVPEQAVQSVHEDIELVKAKAEAGRS